MRTSARNHLRGTVVSVTIGAVMAEGGQVTAIIKPTDVMIGVD